MELTKKEAFIKQLGIYIQANDYNQAYDLGVEFVRKFPDDMSSHFLLAKAAFETGKYDEAKTEGRKAFNLSKTGQDMLVCALLTSTAYLKLGDFESGYALLREMEGKNNSDELQMAMVVFSIALKDRKKVVSHIEKLYKLNDRLATDLARRIIG